MLTACLAPTIAAVALSLSGCASPGDPYVRSAPTTSVANDSTTCPAGYLRVCEVRSPKRISDGRYGFREGRRKSCGCESERDFEAMKKTPLQ